MSVSLKADLRFPISGQLGHGDWIIQFLICATYCALSHFKQELIEYLDYYNNRRIKTKLKGLPPAIHRQQALSGA